MWGKVGNVQHTDTGLDSSHVGTVLFAVGALTLPLRLESFFSSDRTHLPQAQAAPTQVAQAQASPEYPLYLVQQCARECLVCVWPLLPVRQELGAMRGPHVHDMVPQRWV